MTIYFKQHRHPVSVRVDDELFYVLLKKNSSKWEKLRQQLRQREGQRRATESFLQESSVYFRLM